MGVGISGSDNDSVAGMEVDNEMMKEECAAVKADGEAMEKD